MSPYYKNLYHSVAASFIPSVPPWFSRLRKLMWKRIFSICVLNGDIYYFIRHPMTKRQK